jgi:large subunit ribosomal protein L1
MAGRGKRYEAALGKLNGEDNGRRVMPADEALAKVKETASAKFDETVDVVIRLGVDAKSGEQMVRGVVTLPHGSGKSPRVVAFARGDAAQAAEAAGGGGGGGGGRGGPRAPMSGAPRTWSPRSSPGGRTSTCSSPPAT